ncbi:MAG TPA: hypothetical protein VMW75_05710 [Thermoanaerobaculia bacterium]|nr:hypothetical protein [Thermoanaerobaculia bacterium]
MIRELRKLEPGEDPAKHVAKAYEALKETGVVPFSGKPSTEKGSVHYVGGAFGLDKTELTRAPVYSKADPKDHSVLNETMESHPFHPGSVKHQIVVMNNAVNMVTAGRGTGRFARLNEIVGPCVFARHQDKVHQKTDPEGYAKKQREKR